VALLRISQLLLLFITLAVGELDLQALEIDAVQHAHIDACHAREEVRICHCKSGITPFSRTKWNTPMLRAMQLAPHVPQK
jgi:hypothetical protein